MPGKLRGAAGTGDDDAQAALVGGAGVTGPCRWGYGAAETTRFSWGTPNSAQDVGGGLERRPIGIAAHDDADEGLDGGFFQRGISEADEAGGALGGGERCIQGLAEGGDVAHFASRRTEGTCRKCADARREWRGAASRPWGALEPLAAPSKLTITGGGCAHVSRAERPAEHGANVIFQIASRPHASMV